MSRRYSYCAVPQCTSTSTKTPEKRFFKIPMDERRKLWMKAMRRSPTDVSPKASLYICEDHFDVSTQTFKLLYTSQYLQSRL